MEVRNRISDVDKLRCNACQDFLKMTIKPGWQKEIYDIAKDAIEHNRYANNYRPTYEKMRDIGIDNYSVDNMDVTFITQVVCFCPSVVTVHKNTKEALKKLRDDRNLNNHLNENEDAEELYLRELLSLCNLKNFINNVDKNEVQIDDEKRLLYRSKYILKIEELTDILDKERIELIQRAKDIRKDINKLLACKDEKTRLRLWCDISKLYMDREGKLEKTPESYYEFMVKASEAGITQAHIYAATYFQLKKDYVEMERRLRMLYGDYEKISAIDAKNIIDSINWYLSEGNRITPGMLKMAEGIIDLGFPVMKSEDGIFLWKRRTP